MSAPTSPTRRFDLVVLCGTPGVGKLAVARELRRQTAYALFHNHLVVDAVGALFPFGSRPFNELRESLWLLPEDRVSGHAYTHRHNAFGTRRRRSADRRSLGAPEH